MSGSCTFPHKSVTARKARRCDLCEQEIPVGTSYLRASTVDSDGWTHHHVHAACEALRVADPTHDLAETLGDQVALWFDYLRDLTPAEIAVTLKGHPPAEIARLTALWQRNP